MSYILKHLNTKAELIRELNSQPQNIKYYAKYDTFIGETDAIQYLDSKIQEYFNEL